MVIVGGGPAGRSSAAATISAEPPILGRIIVLEKGRSPRDKYCGGALRSGRHPVPVLATPRTGALRSGRHPVPVPCSEKWATPRTGAVGDTPYR